jgi:glycosyltransferase involved in cell wall biosynthesis
MIVKVSVIIPVYNVEQYLRQCLDSVINQTYKDIEIIIVNDCSPDNSLKIIKEYQEKDKRIVLVDLKNNVGLGFARNEGMKVAKGKYITFVDSDDWVTKDYVEVLYKTIEQYKYDVISPDFYEYDDITQRISKSKHPKNFYNINISTTDIKQKLLCCEHIHYARKIYKLQFLKENYIDFKINKFEDTLFIWEIILKTNKFMFINNKIYYYRINRKGSIMATQNSESFNNMNLFYALKDLIYKNENNKKDFDSVLNFFIMNRFLDFAWRNSANFNIVYPKFKKQYLNDKKIEFYYPNTLRNFIKAKMFKYILKFNINIVTISFFITCYKKIKRILNSLIGR